MSWATAAAAAVAALAGFGAGYAIRRARTCPRPNIRVALVGDSLAEGLAAPLARKAVDCPMEYIATAQGATRTQQWAGSRLDEAIAFKPDILLVSLGGNDFRHSDPKRIVDAVDRIVERAHGVGAVVYWIMPPPMPFADDAGVVAIWKARVHCRFETHEVDFPQQSDRIHPTAAGYRQLADAVWDWLTFESWNRCR